MRISRVRISEYVLRKLQWKHHVAQEEVKEVLSKRPRLFFLEDGDVEGENLYLALGRTASGRYLSVFFIHKRDHAALIVSARDMADKERRRYEKK